MDRPWGQGIAAKIWGKPNGNKAMGFGAVA